MAATTRIPSRFRRLAAAFALALILMPDSSAQAVQTSSVADTVVVVVSSDSPVTEITRLHLADLYLGRTTRFPNGEPAEVIDQGTTSAPRADFYERYLGRSPAEIKAHWSRLIFTGRGRPPRDVVSGEDMRRLVAENPGTIGYIERSLVDGSVHIVRVE
ncbi:MAG TPA: phosphate ABC transporter substrate-binding protein [Gemmatimonadota bacterium]|nr:phosphate ABC transporter substrate-binding protein [Gemmatimonadota bacterium]